MTESMTGKDLKKIREEQDWSQEQAARKAGVTHQTWYLNEHRMEVSENLVEKLKIHGLLEDD